MLVNCVVSRRADKTFTMNGDRQRRQQQENNNAGAWVAGAAGVAGIAALIGGGLYYLTRGRAEPQQVNQPSSSSDSDSDTARNHNSVTRSRGPAIREGNSNGTLSYLTGLMDRVNMGNDDSGLVHFISTNDQFTSAFFKKKILLIIPHKTFLL